MWRLFIILFTLFFINLANASELKLNVPLDINLTKPTLEPIGYTHKQLLTCNVPLDAIYKISSATTLKIIPKKSFRAGSNYQCNFNGQIINFTTSPLAILDTHFFKDSSLLRVEFNDEIESSTILKSMKLVKSKNLTKTNLNYTLTHNQKGVVVLKLNEVLDGTLDLIVTSELLTTHKVAFAHNETVRIEAQMAKPVVLDAQKKPLTFEQPPLMVANDDGTFSVYIFGSDSFNNESMNQFFTIDGIENLSVSPNQYMDYDRREKLKLGESASYYTELSSPLLSPHSTYHLRLKKGLSTYESELKSDREYNLYTSDRARSIFFGEDKSYIPSIGEIGFKSVNVQNASIVVEQVLDDNYRYFLTYNNASQYDMIKFTKEIFSKQVTLSTAKNEVTKQKFLLEELYGKLPYGIYKVSFHYMRGDEEKVVSKILFISDIGINVNLSASQALVSLISLSDAEVMDDVNVELYGENNELLAKAESDNDGVVQFDVKKLASKKPLVVIASNAKDKNFLMLNDSLNGVSKESLDTNRSNLKAYIFLQSDIIRPLGEIHSLITIKDKAYKSLAKEPFTIKLIHESSGDEIEKKTYTTNELGMIDFSYTMSNFHKTGGYLLEVYRGDILIGSSFLQVESFMPPKIRTQLQTNKLIFANGDLMETNISSAYLFGANASNLQGKMRLSASPKEYDNSAFKGYVFSRSEELIEPIENYFEHEEPIVLNSAGVANILTPINISTKPPSILSGLLGVTIMDDTQPVSKYQKITIYPYAQMVGLKVNQDAFKEGKLNAHVVLIDPLSGKKIENANLIGVLKKIDRQYSFHGGSYTWEQTSSVIEKFEVKSSSTLEKSLPTDGEYLLEVSDPVSGHSSSITLQSWGGEFSSVNHSDDLEKVEILFEDKLYKAGDEIEATFKSPILEGTLLVTLENEGVVWYDTTTISKGVASMDIELKEPINEGFYIHATAVRKSDKASAIVPYRATGYAKVHASKEEHKMNLKIIAPKESKSNQKLNVEVQSDSDGSVVVSLIDSGILETTEQKSPNPHGFFNELPDKMIAYFDLYDNVIAYLSEGKKISFGAGGGEESQRKMKHLPPQDNDRIKPLMKYSKIVPLVNHKANVSFDIAEFNGEATIQVVGVDTHRIGATEAKVSIEDDIMMMPSYPKYGLQGDILEVPIRIFNNTAMAQNVVLKEKSNNKLMSLMIGKNSFVIPAKSFIVIDSKLYVTFQGNGVLSLEAITSQGTKAVTTLNLPIYSPYGLVSKSFQGMSKTPVKIDIPLEYQNAKVQISLSNNFLGTMQKEINYLITYPYGCAEQTSSALSAMYYAKAFIDTNRTKDSEYFILQGVKRLVNMQNFYGEFSYWENQESVNPYASLYTAQTLLELNRANGAWLASSTKDKILNMLNKVSTLSGSYMATYTPIHQIYAGYILSQNGSLPSSTLNMLYEKGLYSYSPLSYYYMASMLKKANRSAEAKTLLATNPWKLSTFASTSYGDSAGNFESNTRDMMLAFIVKKEDFALENGDFETIQSSLDKLYSTQDKAVALKAISLYLGKPKSTAMSVSVKWDNQISNYLKPITFYKEIKSLKTKRIEIIPTANPVAYSIDVMDYLPMKIKNIQDKTKALSLTSQFVDSSGKVLNINTLKQGDKLYAKVTLFNQKKLDRVVLNQRVPSCMTILNSNLEPMLENSPLSLFAPKGVQIEHRDILDDRVLYFINLDMVNAPTTNTEANSTVLDNGELNVSIPTQKQSSTHQATIYTPLMVTTKGECRLPPVSVEAMYDSRINDYAIEFAKFTIK